MDIVEFVTARLDEEHADATAAQEADPAPWRANTTKSGSTDQRHGHGSGLVIAGDDTALWDCEGSNTLCMTAPTARHIARHDPARVLREVQAKRAILGDLLVEIRLNEWILKSDRDLEPDMSEPLLRLLALPYANHSDYDPSWSPE